MASAKHHHLDTLSTNELKSIDAEYHMHPFTNHRTLAVEGTRVITKAEGVYLWDSEGKKALDAMAGLWCVMVGYGRQELIDAAALQMKTLPFYNSFFKTTTSPSILLAERLVQRAPEGIKKVMYANSGSEAVDTAIRMVRHFWNLEGKPDKKIIIGRKFGYHGSTMAAASVGGMTPMHQQGDLPLPGFVHVLPPYWFGEGGDMSPEEFGRYAAKMLEIRIKGLGADKVAAFFAEPIQGAGGVIIPPESYWPEVQRICRENNVLLVADEVICGFGRLGKWFGSHYYNIKPDLMTIAKGITSGYVPLSAVLVGERVAQTLVERGEEFYHGFTYSGHPVACAVGLANLDVIENERLIERVAEDTGPYLFKKMQETLADHPIVGEVRMVGLIGAIELCADKKTRTLFPGDGAVGLKCRDHCFKNGLIMRAVRDTMVFSPPLTITRSEIDEMVALAKLCLDLTAKDLGRS